MMFRRSMTVILVLFFWTAMASAVDLSFDFKGTEDVQPGGQLCLSLTGSSPTPVNCDVYVVMEVAGLFFFAPTFTEAPALAFSNIAYGPTMRSDEVFPCVTLGPNTAQVPLTWYAASFESGTANLNSNLASGTQTLKPETSQPGDLPFLTVGNSLRFRVNFGDNPGDFDQTVARTEQHNGETVYVIESTNGHTDYATPRTDGVYICGRDGVPGECRMGYKYPCTAGETFMSSFLSDDTNPDLAPLTVVSTTETITIPAGTFTNVIHYQSSGAGPLVDVYFTPEKGQLLFTLGFPGAGEFGRVEVLSFNY